MKTRIIVRSLLLVSLLFSVPAGAGNNVQEVITKKKNFIPQELTVKVGTKVRWVNKNKRGYHTVWFKEQGEEESDYIFPDESVERVFNEVGRFPYRCGPHKRMTGVINVVN